MLLWRDLLQIFTNILIYRSLQRDDKNAEGTELLERDSEGSRAMIAGIFRTFKRIRADKL